MEEYTDLFENVIAKTGPKVDYIDIRSGIGDNTSILMKDGEIEMIFRELVTGGQVYEHKN